MKKFKGRFYFVFIAAAALLTAFIFGLPALQPTSPSGELKGESVIVLPVGQAGDNRTPFVKHGDYFYYQGEDGVIYRSAAASPGNPQSLFPLPTDQDGRPLSFDFLPHNGQLWVRCSADASEAGSINLLRIRDDGSWEDISPASRFEYHESEAYTVYADLSYPVTPGNLLARSRSGDSFYPLGDPALYYRLAVKGDAISGNTVYALGSASADGPGYLYAVDLETGNAELVLDFLLAGYEIHNGILYFTGPGSRNLYRMPLDSGDVRLVANGMVWRSQVIGDTVFYSLEHTSDPVSGVVSGGRLYSSASASPLTRNLSVSHLAESGGLLLVYWAVSDPSSPALSVLSPEGVVLFEYSKKRLASVAAVYVEDGQPHFIVGG